MIKFDPVEHRYSWYGTRYTSVTQVLSKYGHEFNSEEQSVAMAERHGKTPQYWKKKWDKITDQSLRIGDDLHAEKEELTLSQAFEVVAGRPVRVQNEHRMEERDYWYWPDGIYPELTLWNHNYKVAGRADRVILTSPYPFSRGADIEDYKTNKRIRKYSWWNKETQSWRMMKAPVSHLVDCEYWHYTLQLSMYQFLLEQMGFIPGTRKLLHFPPLPPDMGHPKERRAWPDVYDLPYLREEVIAILEDHAKEI